MAGPPRPLRSSFGLPAACQVTWVILRGKRGKAGRSDENVTVMRLSSKMKRVGASVAIAIGLVLVFIGLASSVTGKAAQKLPQELQSITPVRSATQVQSQEKIEVDLIDGYTGVLIVNGVELPTFSLDELETKPGQQVSLPPAAIFEPGNYTLSFTPTKDAPIEKFATGVNTVTLVYWKISDGRNFAKPAFTWQFDVV